jgi:hypothetical protein
VKREGEEGLGGGAIEEELFEMIRVILPKGTILELGSGDGTKALVEAGYKIYSVEDDPEWWDLHHNNYIHAPRVPHKPLKHHDGLPSVWYDADVLRRELPKIDYDLILVDGPWGNRGGFVKYWELFKHDVPIIFDDVNRTRDRRIMASIALRLEVPCITYHGDGKQFGVIIPGYDPLRSQRRSVEDIELK